MFKVTIYYRNGNQEVVGTFKDQVTALEEGYKFLRTNLHAKFFAWEPDIIVIDYTISPVEN